MQTIMRNTLKLTAVLLLVAALFGAGLSPVKPSQRQPALPRSASDLWAKTGTATLFGSTTVTDLGLCRSLRRCCQPTRSGAGCPP